MWNEPDLFAMVSIKEFSSDGGGSGTLEIVMCGMNGSD